MSGESGISQKLKLFFFVTFKIVFRIINKKVIKMNIADKIVENFVKATYNKIDVKSGNCRFNQKCHLNSVHEALNNNEDKLAMFR